MGPILISLLNSIHVFQLLAHEQWLPSFISGNESEDNGAKEVRKILHPFDRGSQNIGVEICPDDKPVPLYPV